MKTPLVTILLATVLSTTWGADPDQPSPTVKLDAARKWSPTEVVVMLPGIAEPARQAKLSTSLRGVLMEICVREGDEVEAGQTVAVLDNRVAVAQLEVAEAESRRTAAISQAKSELRRAESQLARLRSLEVSRAISESEVDQAAFNRDRAKAALTDAREQAFAAKSRLNLARAQMEVHDIQAPFAGRVLKVEAQLGETVTETDTLVHVADLRTLRVELHVPIRLYKHLECGEVYQLAASSPIDRAVSATLISAAPLVDAATQTFRCVFHIEEQLVAGFAARLIRPNQMLAELATHAPDPTGRTSAAHLKNRRVVAK